MLTDKAVNELRQEAARMRLDGQSNRIIAINLAGRILSSHGEKPTTQLLIELLRDREAGTCPSMTTIQSALKQFWEKEKATRTQGELIADVYSPELRRQANDLFNGLLLLANTQAEERFNAFREEADEREAVLRRDLQDKDRDIDRMQQFIDEKTEAERSLLQSLERTEVLVGELNGRHAEAQNELERRHAEIKRLQEEIEQLRATHAHTIDELRTQAEQKLTALTDQLAQTRLDAQKNISGLEKLLATSDDTIQKLRLDVVREIDRSEAMRGELASTKNALKTAEAHNIEQGLRLAILESKQGSHQIDHDRQKRRHQPSRPSRILVRKKPDTQKSNR